MPERLSFDRVAMIYDETRGLPPKAMARLLAVLIDELHGKRLLEVGVGTGRYAVPLQKSGIRVVGVDISHPMVELGLAKGLRNVAFADGARLPFRSGSFDMSTTSHVLHLIPDWRDVLRELGRVTRDSYFTIIERSHHADSIKKEYDDLVRKSGWTWVVPGLHERDLPALLKPDLLIPVGPFQEVRVADVILKELEARSYSSQWEVPEKVHRAVMSTLHKKWSGQDLKKSYTLEVTFWRAIRLPELAKAPVHGS